MYSKNSRRPFLIRLFLLVLAVTLFVPAAEAQYFGRNKVQWEDFDFKVLKTEHFDVYYYGEDDPAIHDAARMAERWYERLSQAFQHELSERKPIVLYKNHPDFQQTTTTGGMIGEGTGGFTDFFLNRVVMPLTANYADTDHVLGHELVHVFQFDIERTLQRGRGAGRLTRLPLWMIEGLAEYLSQGRVDPQTALWLRDAMVHGNLPSFRDLTQRQGEFSPYQFGQAFWAYVAGTWGDQAATRLFVAAAALGMETAFQRVLERSPEEVFTDWHREIREAYQPTVLARLEPGLQGRAILSRRTTDARMNLAPVLNPDGTMVAFLSTRDLFTIDLYLADAQSGRVLRHLVSAATTPHFDALRFIDSAGAWSPDGQRFAFVVFERGDNRLGIVDVGTREIEERIEIPGVPALSNPAWSPDGRRIAFAGTVEGVSDIYIYDLETRQVTRLMNDAHGDLQPAWSPDGRTIVFASDRGPATDFTTLVYSRMQLAAVDVATRQIRLLPLFENATHHNPQFSPDGREIYFIADPDGIPEVYRYTLGSNEIARVTSTATGVAGITLLSPAMSVARNSGRMMYSVLDEGEYVVFGVDPSVQRGTVIARNLDIAPAGVLPPLAVRESVVASYLATPTLGLVPEERDFNIARYSPSLQLDYVGPPSIGVGFAGGNYGLGGAVSARFGDILGEHQLGVVLQTQSTGSRNLTEQIGGQIFYLNQAQRINWGAALMHVPYVSGARRVRPVTIDVDGQPAQAFVVEELRETMTIDEAEILSQYPFGRTRRLELNGGYTHYGFDREIEEFLVFRNRVIDRQITDIDAPPSLNLFNGGVAFVGDSSFFGFVSPVRGTRYRFEAEAFGGDLQFQTALADYRRYAWLRPLTLAFRGMHYGRYGTDAEDSRMTPLFIGYDTLVRGYNLDSFNPEECTTRPGTNECPEFDRLVGSKMALFNLEARVPLLGFEGFGLIEAPFFPTELLAFVDGGVAWTEDEDPELRFERETTERVPVFSAGLGLRIVLGGYLPIHLYYAYPLQRPEEDAVFGFTIAPGW